MSTGTSSQKGKPAKRARMRSPLRRGRCSMCNAQGYVYAIGGSDYCSEHYNSVVRAVRGSRAVKIPFRI